MEVIPQLKARRSDLKVALNEAESSPFIRAVVAFQFVRAIATDQHAIRVLDGLENQINFITQGYQEKLDRFQLQNLKGP